MNLALFVTVLLVAALLLLLALLLLFFLFVRFLTSLQTVCYVNRPTQNPLS